MAKKKTAPYREGRSSDWRKIPNRRRDDFVIVGYTEPKGHRTGFGGLLVAQVAGDELVYAGRVGSGFQEADLSELGQVLEASRRPDPPFVLPEPRPPGVWVEPRLVCEVEFLTRTEEGLLRHPVFHGLRPDKSYEPPEPEEPGPAEAGEPEARSRVNFVNLDKLFWPEDGYTKGHLIEFYRAVSDWMLPLLDDRPVVLTRYPDGIEGNSFFQKNTPGFAPDWIRRLRRWSDHSERYIDYLILDSVDALLYAANSATIPIHVWSSRTATLDRPDWLILDLDPKSAPFSDVIRVAKAIRKLCGDLGLPSYPKTSGSSGMHVLIPMGRQLDHEKTRQFAELLARVLVVDNPEIATIDRMLQARKNRVYIDFGQNGEGRLLVSAFSVRPRKGATVSTPLFWREVTKSLDFEKFTIETVPRRLARLKSDPSEGLLETAPDLMSALQLLQARLPED